MMKKVHSLFDSHKSIHIDPHMFLTDLWADDDLFAWHISIPHTSAFHRYIRLIILFPLFQLLAFILLIISSLALCLLKRAEQKGSFMWAGQYLALIQTEIHLHSIWPLDYPAPCISHSLSLSSLHLLSLLLFSPGSVGALPQLSALLPDLSWTVCLLSPGRKARVSTKAQWLLFYKQLLSPLSVFFQLKHIKVSTDLTSLKMKESKSIDPVSSSDDVHFSSWENVTRCDHIVLSSSHLIHSCLNWESHLRVLKCYKCEWIALE